MKGEPDLVDEPWLFRTSALSTEKTRLGQIVHKQRGMSFFDLMNNFKVALSLLSIYLAALLAVLLIGVCIRRLAYWVRFGASIKPKLFRGYFKDQKLGFMKFPALAIFVLFVGQFLWLTELFLTNNIKTNKVVTILTAIDLLDFGLFEAHPKPFKSPLNTTELFSQTHLPRWWTLRS